MAERSPAVPAIVAGNGFMPDRNLGGNTVPVNAELFNRFFTVNARLVLRASLSFRYLHYRVATYFNFSFGFSFRYCANCSSIYFAFLVQVGTVCLIIDVINNKAAAQFWLLRL